MTFKQITKLNIDREISTSYISATTGSIWTVSIFHIQLDKEISFPHLGTASQWALPRAQAFPQNSAVSARLLRANYWAVGLWPSSNSPLCNNIEWCITTHPASQLFFFCVTRKLISVDELFSTTEQTCRLCTRGSKLVSTWYQKMLV